MDLAEGVWWIEEVRDGDGASCVRRGNPDADIDCLGDIVASGANI